MKAFALLLVAGLMSWSAVTYQLQIRGGAFEASPTATLERTSGEEVTATP